MRSIGIRHLDEIEELQRPPVRLPCGEPSVDAQRLGDLPADGVERVERGHRLLEDHGNLRAADVVQLAPWHAEELRPAVAD
jgi:hypothetical protein